MTTFHGGSSFYNIIGYDFSNLDAYQSVVNADALDAWFDPAPAVIDKLTRYLPLTIKLPPPQHAHGLIDTIARVRCIDPERILVGAGSSNLIFTYFPNQIKPGDRVVILDPMYGEYRNILTRLGAEVIYYTLSAGNNFQIDIEDFKNFLQQLTPKFVVMVNPNSPTGQVVEPGDMAEVIHDFKKITFFIDEAYTDFAGDYSIETIAWDNIVVLKSMSKCYALSGARVAYLVASAKTINYLSQFSPPWAVSIPGQIAAIEALNSPEYYKEKYIDTALLRTTMSNQIAACPSVKVYPSVTNYFMVELLEHKASKIVTKLQSQNIFLRNCDSMSVKFKDNFIRIAIKGCEADSRIVKALSECIKQQ